MCGGSSGEAAAMNERQRFKDQTALLADLAEHSGDAEFHDIDAIRAELLHDYDVLRARVEAAEEILRKATAPRRPEGTYNFSREAFEQMANDYFAAVVPVEKQP